MRCNCLYPDADLRRRRQRRALLDLAAAAAQKALRMHGAVAVQRRAEAKRKRDGRL